MKAAFAIILFTLLGIPELPGQGTLSGFSVQPDTVPELDADIEYVPQKQKANLFKGKPGRAALYSLILPGAGQVYNGKVWKVPLVYGVLGSTGYFVFYNSNEYKLFRDAYISRLTAIEEGVTPTDPFYEGHPDYGVQSPEGIRLYRNEYNRLRQISIFVFALAWIANSAEAFVDAHLTDFDVTDDLTFRLNMPSDQEFSAGSIVQVGLCYKF